MPVGTALAQHYAEHGLPADGGEQSAWFRVHVGPVAIPLPNPPARRKAVFFHDVNHVLTGYNTVFSDGEMVIAGFEVGAGCGRFAIAWFINLFMMAFGVVSTPRALFRAFVRGRRSGSIYRRTETRASLWAMNVAQLRALLPIDSQPSHPTAADRVQFVTWIAISWLVTLGAVAAGITAVWGVAIATGLVG